MAVKTQKLSKPFGRPSKYNSLFISQIDDYLKTVGRLQTKLPKRVDIALLLGVDEDTLNNWANAKDKKGNLLHPDFLGALTRVDMMQKSVLMDDGFYGGKEVNPRMAQFLLSANHKMAETTKTDVTTGGEKIDGIQVTIVEARVESKDD